MTARSENECDGGGGDADYVVTAEDLAGPMNDGSRLALVARVAIAHELTEMLADGGAVLSLDQIRAKIRSVQTLGVALHDAGGFQDMRDVAQILAAICPEVYRLVCPIWANIIGFERWQDEGRRHDGR